MFEVVQASLGSNLIVPRRPVCTCTVMDISLYTPMIFNISLKNWRILMRFVSYRYLGHLPLISWKLISNIKYRHYVISDLKNVRKSTFSTPIVFVQKHSQIIVWSILRHSAWKIFENLISSSWYINISKIWYFVILWFFGIFAIGIYSLYAQMSIDDIFSLWVTFRYEILNDIKIINIWGLVFDTLETWKTHTFSLGTTTEHIEHNRIEKCQKIRKSQNIEILIFSNKIKMKWYFRNFLSYCILEYSIL